MPSRILFRLKILISAVKNKQSPKMIVKRFFELKFDKIRRRKRFEQYKKQMVSPTLALEILFPEKTLDSNVFDELEKQLQNYFKKQSDKKPSLENPYVDINGLPKKICRILYFVCWFSKPEIIVETGVANGISSSYILLALKNRNEGKLYSVDGIFMPYHTKEKIGQAIPEHLKNKQSLVIGDSQVVLKKLLPDLGIIDLFLHDSYHTYNQMITEYNIAWPYIKTGGFLTSDIIDLNDAFLDFAEKIERDPIIILEENRFFGIIKK